MVNVYVALILAGAASYGLYLRRFYPSRKAFRDFLNHDGQKLLIGQPSEANKKFTLRSAGQKSHEGRVGDIRFTFELHIACGQGNAREIFSLSLPAPRAEAIQFRFHNKKTSPWYGRNAIAGWLSPARSRILDGVFVSWYKSPRSRDFELNSQQLEILEIFRDQGVSEVTISHGWASLRFAGKSITTQFNSAVIEMLIPKLSRLVELRRARSSQFLLQPQSAARA